jgi:predicted DCC family thiol-disulfide oxidoreductase YuxK
MFERLGFPWSLMAVFRILPRDLRDRLYDFLARNRFRWFGRRKTCLLATPGDDDRFLR